MNDGNLESSAAFHKLNALCLICGLTRQSSMADMPLASPIQWHALRVGKP